MRKSMFLCLLSSLAIGLGGCPSEDNPDECPVPITDPGLTCDEAQQQALASAVIELGDIFIPERLVEIPVLPGGTELINEIHIHNAGDQDLEILEVGLNYQSDDNWEINEDTIPSIIEPHGFAVVELKYTAVEGLDTFAAIDIYSDDVDEAEKTVAFVGHSATAGPDARVSETIVDFGFRFTDTEHRQIIEIRNEGDDDLYITGIELIQSETQPAFALTCPGFELPTWDEEGNRTGGCDFWEDGTQQVLVDEPVLPGSASLLEVAFTPLNLQGVSAQLKVYTSDPIRPQFTIFLLGNGESALNCTPPSITVTSPVTATFFHSWQQMQVSARVLDAEQPAGSLYVQMFLGDLLIEDEFPDENGRVTFDIDIDDNNPPVPGGLQTLTLTVSDGCPLSSADVFVAAIDFPLSQADTDGDGYDPNQGDCAEGNPDIFPQAIEVEDNLDNDCDGTIDENTGVWDDDCDGYCEDDSVCVGPLVCIEGVAAPFGDCNDSTADLDGDFIFDGAPINPGAEEGLNFIDDDCDGTVDENTTYFDDDGDGQTEATGDCDDGDESVFRGAVEWCNGVDSNCDDIIDGSSDGSQCIDAATPPRIIGGVITDTFQVPLGGSVWAEVLVVSPDPQLTYTWSTDRGSYPENSISARVRWLAPTEDDPNVSDLIGFFPTIMVTVSDSLGQNAYGFANVLIADNLETSYSPITFTSNQNGASDCGSSIVAADGSGGSWIAGLLLLGAALRRRKD